MFPYILEFLQQHTEKFEPPTPQLQKPQVTLFCRHWYCTVTEILVPMQTTRCSCSAAHLKTLKQDMWFDHPLRGNSFTSWSTNGLIKPVIWETPLLIGNKSLLWIKNANFYGRLFPMGSRPCKINPVDRKKIQNFTYFFILLSFLWRKD